MNKQYLIDQLAARLRASADTAERSGIFAAAEARDSATLAERKENSQTAIEAAGLARGHLDRMARIRADLATLETLDPSPMLPGARIGLGAVVEVENDEGGRTFFLAPTGAGEELTAPGGDGFFSVVTPHSPLGRAVMNKKLGDDVEVDVGGHTREWTITWVV